MPELNEIKAPDDESGRPESDGLLTIRQINIGQGNLTYIICPNGKRVLIDAGSDDLGTLGLSDVAQYMQYASPFSWKGSASSWRSQKNFLYVDLIILTHCDSDHYNKIPDLVGVLSPIQQIYVGGPVSHYSLVKFRQWYQQRANLETKYNEETEEDEERIQQIFVNQDQPNPLLLCDGGTSFGNTCQIWAIAASVPPAPPVMDGDTVANANSVVVKIVFGKTSAMITGDATASTEDFMRKNKANTIPLATNWMLVPHHGSETSSTTKFVQAVSPQIAVVSAKNGNEHGLPRKEIIERYTIPDMLGTGFPEHQIATYTNQSTMVPMPTTKNIWQTGVSGTKSYTLDGDTVQPE